MKINGIGTYNTVNMQCKNKKQYNPSYLSNLSKDTVSFGCSYISMNDFARNISNTAISDIIIQFSDRLLNIKNLNQQTLEQEINKLLKQNLIENVKIDDISRLNLPEAGNMKIAGKFCPEYSKDYKCKGGTLFLGKIPADTADKEAMVSYCAVVCHELAHVFQYSRNNDNFGMKNYVNETKDIAKYISFGYFFGDTLEPKLIYMPFQDFFNNYQLHGLSYKDYQDVAECTNKYGFPILKTPVKISDSDVEKPFSKNIPFEKYINCMIDASFNAFEKNIAQENYDPQKIRAALLRNYIFNFQNEYEAYSIMSEITKKQYNLKGQTINDLTPLAYKKTIDIMKEKLETEFGYLN